MRTIKFRGKRLDEAWVYGSLAIDANSNHTILSPLSDKSGSEFWNNQFQFSDVDPNTVGQFTGLTDKNGKEIYEGDILSDGKGENGVVMWVESLGGFRVNVNGCLYQLNEGNPNRELQLEYTEIIGNIHDNPELLKEDKQKD